MALSGASRRKQIPSSNTEKTRLVRFGRPSRAGGTGDKPETFDFLGFTHYWGMSQKGNQVVMKKTAKGRFRRTLQAIKEWGDGTPSPAHEGAAAQAQ
jgi:hypothetical protein